MSLNAEERTAVVEFRLEKAQRAYEQACGVVEKGYWETIANRLYYAAYNAVSALLIAYGYSAQSHSVSYICSDSISSKQEYFPEKWESCITTSSPCASRETMTTPMG